MTRRAVFTAAGLFFLGTVAHAETASRPSESGIASWYGTSFDGRLSASGEIYDQEQLTAAHRDLPFGTRVRVRRVDRGDSVVVRINDRGPYVKSRIIDLSHAAAVQLGMIDGGVAEVTIEVVERPPVTQRRGYKTRTNSSERDHLIIQ
ncbi:MAG TPA: septal ring lytic transglycosylase RlpA family protein [Bryobacteraceae bacterium]|nr:septal ring lytic transglycosylase RlpA family protein [Bryobacteraceae bacterium]